MGHGNHWEAIGADTEEAITHWIPKVVSNGVLTAATKFDFDDGETPPREEEAVGIVYPQTPLRFLAIVATDSTQEPPSRFLFSGYPFLFEGCPQKIEIERVEDWANPLEGLVHGTTEGGAGVCFFDPLYFLNKAKYQVGSSF